MRKCKSKSMKLFIKFIFLTLLFSCSENYVYENKLKYDVKNLSDDKYEGREAGKNGEKEAAKYIESRFKEIGLHPKGTEEYIQPFNFKNNSNPHSRATIAEDNSDGLISSNVIGYIDNKSETTVVFGAHYDHLGFGNSSSLSSEKEIHNGADDNASGVAIILDLASKLINIDSSNNYLFIAFGAEELGLLGSNYFNKYPTVDIESINYMFNFDMVGRLNDQNNLAIYGTGTSPIFKQTILSNNKEFKITEHESGQGPSDHTSFYLSDIPVLHFFTGQHSEYHKPTDDFELINFEGLEKISNYIIELVNDLDDNGKLKFKKTKDENSRMSPKFSVTLGVMPDYLFDGKGMKIDGVSSDKPAEKGGILKGDIVIKIDKYDIENMMSYMETLSKFKKGDKVTVSVLRNSKIEKINIEF